MYLATMAKFRTTATADYASIISTDSVKDHLRVEHTVDDTLIGSLRDAACEWVESYTLGKIGSRTGISYANAWNTEAILAHPFEVTAVKYYNASDVKTTMPTTDYHVDTISRPGLVKFMEQPTLQDDAYNRVHIELTVGWTVANVPDSIAAAVKLLVGHWYEHRQAEVVGTISSSLKLGVEALLAPHRIILAA